MAQHKSDCCALWQTFLRAETTVISNCCEDNRNQSNQSKPEQNRVRCTPATLWQIPCGFYNLIQRMLSFLKSMQPVVYLQHIALVTASADFTEDGYSVGD